MIPEIKRILLPVDFGDSSIAPVRYASRFAQRFGAEVVVMYADELATLYAEFDPVWIEKQVQPAQEREREERALRQFAAEHLAGVKWTTEVIVGHPVDSIVRTAKEQEADLIIMGTHGRRGWRRALTGSVADGVVRAAAKPVLVVPAWQDERSRSEKIQRVLCPVNFTEAAHDAAQYACGLANTFDAELVLVHVQETSDMVDSEFVHSRFRKWLPHERRIPCSFRELVLRGGPAERVLDCVEDSGADLLVMGAQIKWLRNETILGTTAERLLRFSPIPILSVARKAADVNAKQEQKLAGAAAGS